MDMNVALIPIMGMAIPIVLVPVTLAMKHARRERELEHTERMKALELGRTLPGDESWWSPSRICVAFGVVVPVGVFLCAWLAAQSDPRQAPAAWFAATVVGLAGVISGAVLAARHFQQISAAPQPGEHGVGKPVFDADTFDVVGSRG